MAFRIAGMRLLSRTLAVQRGAVLAVLAMTALVFSTKALDVFTVPKFTVLLLGTLVAVGSVAVRLAWFRQLEWPRTWLWLPIAIFVGALLIAWWSSAAPAAALVGRPGRNIGLAMYVAVLALFAVTLRAFRETSASSVVAALLLTAVPITLYGLAQAAGLEFYDWRAVEGGPQVFATFGNANTFSAWLGMVAPLGVWAALRGPWSRPVRAASAALTAAMLLAAVLSGSLQGPVGGGAGVVFVLVVWLYAAPPAAVRRRAPLIFAGLGAIAMAAVAAVVTGFGPFAQVSQVARQSFRSRLPMWEAAWAMLRDRPLRGVGFPDYPYWYHAYRTQETAVEIGLTNRTDTPHNVPLEMFASGGVPLGLAYLAIVAGVAILLIRGLRRLPPDDRLCLGALGGGWLAYQIQSLVSLDLPPLAALHWVLAALIVLYGGRPTWTTLYLPGAVSQPAGKGARKAGKARPREAHGAVAAAALVVLVLLPLTWAALLPLRAARAGMLGKALANAGRHFEAVERFHAGGNLAAWESTYPALRGKQYVRLGNHEAALAAYTEALSRAPRDLELLVIAARLEALTGDEPAAVERYAQVLRVDSKTPEILHEAGAFLAEHGDRPTGRKLMERAVALKPDQAEWWVALAEAYEADGDTAAAREALRQALHADPGNEEARRLLELP